ncbi:MAG: hypothetical protein IKU29_02450 [Parabacteroides sp.]|nr:hypothetical protein [Parabacteroides sp.]
MMNNFTTYIKEGRERSNYNSEHLLRAEINRYLEKVNKIIPKHIKDVIYLTQKYNLVAAEDIKIIKNSNKSKFKELSDVYNIPLDIVEYLWKQLKEMKNNIKMLPQFQSKTERESIMLGKLSVDDLTIDLSSNAGRNAATKMYMPVVYKIVNQYVGASKLSRQELMSAALEGFTDAINNWKHVKQKSIPFKSYMSYRVQQQILHDINKYSHTLSLPNLTKTALNNDIDAMSIDAMLGDNDKDMSDKISKLGMVDADIFLDKDEEKNWKFLYTLLEQNFKQRDVNVFYRYFGLNGCKREKSKDIAKSLGLSEGAIRNVVINKMISFLKNNRQAMEVLMKLQDIYNESLMVELVGCSREEIMEVLINDDTFILLEELNRWRNKSDFEKMIKLALSELNNDKDLIIELLDNDFEYLDSNYKKNRHIILKFLSIMYPTESFIRATDIDILEKMIELHEYWKKYNMKS